MSENRGLPPIVPKGKYFSPSKSKANILDVTLFGSSFTLHFIWCLYIFKEHGIGTVTRSQQLLGNVYSVVGFEWNGLGAYLVAGALLSSLFANTLRRVLEGLLLGWPRFSMHNKGSLTDSFWILLGYGLITFFAAGFFGEKFATKNIDLLDAILIAAMTYIFGLIVNFFDEFLSATYIVFRGDKA